MAARVTTPSAFFLATHGRGSSSERSSHGDSVALRTTCSALRGWVSQRPYLRSVTRSARVCFFPQFLGNKWVNAWKCMTCMIDIDQETMDYYTHLLLAETAFERPICPKHHEMAAVVDFKFNKTHVCVEWKCFEVRGPEETPKAVFCRDGILTARLPIYRSKADVAQRWPSPKTEAPSPETEAPSPNGASSSASAAASSRDGQPSAAATARRRQASAAASASDGQASAAASAHDAPGGRDSPPVPRSRCRRSWGKRKFDAQG